MNRVRTLAEVHGTRVFDNLNEMLSLSLSSHANPPHSDFHLRRCTHHKHSFDTSNHRLQNLLARKMEETKKITPKIEASSTHGNNNPNTQSYRFDHSALNI